MIAITKFGFATLVAVVLLMTPIGFCADAAMPQDAPAHHPCCPAKPAPLPNDCARPGCIYMDTSVAPVALMATNDAGPVGELVLNTIGMEIRPALPTARSIPLAPLPPCQRFVVFHQFLI